MPPVPTPLDALVPTIPYHPVWPFSRTRPYTVPYLAWDDTTVRNSDGGATVTVAATDKLTGMKVTGTITLSPEAFDILQAVNDGDSSRP